VTPPHSADMYILFGFILFGILVFSRRSRLRLLCAVLSAERRCPFPCLVILCVPVHDR
jgi:hypothetical protein